ncbi:MAG: DNA polymerase III subunit delta [Bacteroidia bacterium]|nr:DNA polymerase III subunit delta [Bacteroidia bacterium]
MAVNNSEFKNILSNLKARKFAPVYFLYGEEQYYIDEISNYAEKNILSDAEKGFNQTVLYGKDVDVLTIINHAKRFPMMSDYQVLIVKEAQNLKKIEELETYLDKPLTSTILIICYKKDKVDKRTRFYKALGKHVVFESKKLYPNELPDWIESYLKQRGFSIQPKSANLIADSLGSDLGKISNELEKLIINKEGDKTITDTDVELKIGISKEFNVFELINAISTKNSGRAMHIAHYMVKNKDFSIIATLINLNNFFNKVYVVKQSKIKDAGTLQKQFGLNFMQVKDCLNAASRFSADELEHCIRVMQEYDLKSKGVNNISATPEELLKEILFKIL